MNLSGHFVESESGRVFVTACRSDQPSNVAVICAPPGVEELNICRRQISVQAQQMCSAGLDTFVMDYYGTGDSEGRDFDATFENWQQSFVSVVQWVIKRGYRSIILWGVRVGALVIAEYLYKHKPREVLGVLFWQPLESGAQWVNTLQRLQLLSGKQASNSQYCEVAGYQLSQELLEPIKAFNWAQYALLFEQFPLDIIVVSPKGEVSDRLAQAFSFSRSILAAKGGALWSIPESPINHPLNELSLNRLRGNENLGA